MWIGLIDLIRLDQDRDLICIKNLVSRLPQDLNFGSGLYCVFLSSDLDLDLESGFRIGIFFLFLDLDFCDFLHIVHLDLDLLGLHTEPVRRRHAEVHNRARHLLWSSGRGEK